MSNCQKYWRRTVVFCLSVALGASLAYASNVSEWNTSAGLNNSAPPNGAPEGMAPSGVNDVIRENMAALARWYSDSDGTLESTGSSNTYTLTTNSTHTALNDIPLTTFRVNHPNTGAATLNVDGLGAKSLRANGASLESGALIVNTIISVAYNATDDAFDLVNTWIPTSIPDASLSANIPLLNSGNIFLQGQRINTTFPEFEIYDSDAGTDEKLWSVGATAASSDIFEIRTRTDADGQGAVPFSISRTGTTASEIDLTADTLDFNGVATFNSAPLFDAVTPGYTIFENDAAADNRRWDTVAVSERILFRAINDATTVTTSWLSVDRTGTTIDEIELNATLLDVNSNADISGSLLLGTALAVAEGGTASTTASGARTALGVAIGSDVQAWDADLDAIAALADTDGNFIVGNGSAWVAESGATVRASLGLGALATLGTVNNAVWSGTDLAVANGGTGASTAAAAAENIGVGATDSPQFGAIQLGHASDTTLTRTAAGVAALEGNTIWHAGSDGAGSGLDADTLDGVQASAFLQASSGSFTVDYDLACTTTPSQTWSYVRHGNVVTVDPGNAGFGCTSDSVLFADRTAPVPAAIRPASTVSVLANVRDNGVVSTGCVQILANGDVELMKPIGVTCSGGWTSSGSKGAFIGTFSYILNN